MTDYKSTITAITVHDDSRDCLTDLEATVIKLADDGGGAYITIVQGENEIRLDINELPLVNEAIDRLMMQHRTKPDIPNRSSSSAVRLYPRQKWQRADGREVIVCCPTDEQCGDNGMLVGTFYASPDGTYDHDEGWWYEDDGTVEGIADSRPDLNLVKLLQP